MNTEQINLINTYKAIETTDKGRLLPMDENIPMAGFALTDSEELTNETLFFRMLSQAIENDCDLGFLDMNITDDEIRILSESISNAELILFAIFLKPSDFEDVQSEIQRIKSILKKLSKDKKTMIIFFSKAPEYNSFSADTIIRTTDSTEASLAAAIFVLCGRKPEFYN